MRERERDAERKLQAAVKLEAAKADVRSFSLAFSTASPFELLGTRCRINATP